MPFSDWSVSSRQGAGLIAKAGTQVFLSWAGAETGKLTYSELTEFARRGLARGREKREPGKIESCVSVQRSLAGAVGGSDGSGGGFPRV